MTRKTKTRVAVALGIPILIAFAFWLGAEEGELKVAFAGVSSNDESLVWFNITNTSKDSFIYIRTRQEREGRAWIDLDYGSSNFLSTVIDENRVHGEIMGHCATNIQRSVTYRKPWRLQIAYTGRRGDSLVFRTRIKLARSAYRHDWRWLGRLLRPVTNWRYANGPVMVENKPVETAKP